MWCKRLKTYESDAGDKLQSFLTVHTSGDINLISSWTNFITLQNGNKMQSRTLQKPTLWEFLLWRVQ